MLRFKAVLTTLLVYELFARQVSLGHGSHMRVFVSPEYGQSLVCKTCDVVNAEHFAFQTSPSTLICAQMMVMNC